MEHTELLVIGAGPYGLATAAYAGQQGIAYRIVGEPMGFWKHSMPHGMLLRSGPDWHLDAGGTHTFLAFLAAHSLDPAKAYPLPVELFLEYASWFQQRAGIVVQPARVVTLNRVEAGYQVQFSNGEGLRADRVVVATGLATFAHVPEDFGRSLAPGCVAHASEFVDFGPLQGKRCLIVGGRQSAFEWAALILAQAGEEVHLVYEHATPGFARSDWSWIEPHLAATLNNPGWYRQHSLEERQEIGRRFWAAGRLKLEPWLAPLLSDPRARCLPGRRVVHLRQAGDGSIDVVLDDGDNFRVDQVILATGYQVDVHRLPFLSPTTILPRLTVQDGYPRLDEQFQSSLPGLFFPGLTATRDFGPYFGFVRGCPVAARVIGDFLARPAAR